MASLWWQDSWSWVSAGCGLEPSDPRGHPRFLAMWPQAASPAWPLPPQASGSSGVLRTSCKVVTGRCHHLPIFSWLEARVGPVPQGGGHDPGGGCWEGSAGHLGLRLPCCGQALLPPLWHRLPCPDALPHSEFALGQFHGHGVFPEPIAASAGRTLLHRGRPRPLSLCVVTRRRAPSAAQILGRSSPRGPQLSWPGAESLLCQLHLCPPETPLAPLTSDHPCTECIHCLAFGL